MRLPLIVLSAVLGYYYVAVLAPIEARLHGERDACVPRVFARPLELRKGQALGEAQLIDRLNDLGYAQRRPVEKPGEFAVTRRCGVALIPRGGEQPGQPLRIAFDAAAARRPAQAPPAVPVRISAIESAGTSADSRHARPAAPHGAHQHGREKRRQVPLAAIPSRMVQAVLAIEDRRFYEHPASIPSACIGALCHNLRGKRSYLVGGSTITQQLARNFFLTEELAPEAATRQRSCGRKLLEQFMALILERKATKDEILELYLNDVYLGQRGSFAHPRRRRGGAAVLRQGRQQPLARRSGDDRRHDPVAGHVVAVHRPSARTSGATSSCGRWPTPASSPPRPPSARRTSRCRSCARALDAQAPYFVDYVGQTLASSSRA